jgi:mercuric ion binding protein
MKTLSILILALSVTAQAATPKEVPLPAKAAATSSKASAKTPAVQAKTIVADVDGIVCAFCVQGIQKKFKSNGKADEVVISLELKKVFVVEKAGQTITDTEFTDMVRLAGFKTRSITRSPLTVAEVKSRLASKQPLVAQAPTAKPVHSR